ncbi:TPA: hypothetical protein ACTT0P_004467 [Yersinia enterocolitica]
MRQNLKLTTLEKLHNELLKDPEYRIAYEKGLKNPDPDYQIVCDHDNGTEEIVFDTKNGNNQPK